MQPVILIIYSGRQLSPVQNETINKTIVDSLFIRITNDIGKYMNNTSNVNFFFQ